METGIEKETQVAMEWRHHGKSEDNEDKGMLCYEKKHYGVRSWMWGKLSMDCSVI